LITVLLFVVAATVIGLGAWRAVDALAASRAWRHLAACQPSSPRTFDAGAVSELPEPAQRFFRFAIEPGAPLLNVAEIRMQGEIGLGNRDNPNYQPMRALQISAAPNGFVWRLSAGRWLRVAGSDGAVDGLSWSRFWLCGLVPVGRSGGGSDHLRSAFGRCLAEALFWTPAALLSGDGIRWEQVDGDTARVTVTRDGLEQSVDVEVDPAGRPVQVAFARWTDANADKVFRLQPFGGYLSEFESFGGYRLPTRVEGGNFFGTSEYFPFFRAKVSSISFPQRPPRPT
jgi:hypothetical protein